MVKPVSEKRILVDDLEVRVLYKHMRTKRLYVKPPDGHIEISVPVCTLDAEVARLVREKRAWIEKARGRMGTSRMAQAERADDEQIRQWRNAVQERVPPLVAAWEPILGVKAGKLAYRNMKSRWGSCQPATGRICINVRLALYPSECLEYVVVHELCHLLVHGHGRDFKELMDRVMPDWKQRSAKLT